MKKLSCMCVCFFLSLSLLVAQKADAFKWMTGSWKIQKAKGAILEVWQIANDSTLSGKSYFIKEKDSILQEIVEIAFRNGEWYYIPTVQGQNDNQPVRFKIIYSKGTEFISENPSHDFPQRISYRRIQKQLFASIEGKNNGKYGKQNFDFVLE